MKSKLFIYTVVLLMLCIVSPNVKVFGSAFAEERFQYNAKGMRDPFIPLLNPDGTPNTKVYGLGSVEELVLEGIAWDENGKGIAVLNGSLVKEGDTVNDLTVMKITKKGVLVSVNGKEHMIPIVREEE